MPTYNSPALDKGLDILEFLSSQSIPQSQSEIGSGINRKPNEIYRMLVCLEERGYIRKEPISGKYQLTLRLFQLSHHHSSIDYLVKAAMPYLEQLSEAILQSCHLSFFYRNKLLILCQAKSMTPISLSVEVGGVFPITQTNSGKIILANKSESERKQILNASEDFQQLSNAEKIHLEKELTTLKDLKCFVQKSTLTEGVTDFASPVYDINNEVMAVLVVSGLTSQLKNASQKGIIKEILKTVDGINVSIGGVSRDKK
ncbi:IclR family transcriptional regulator [Persicobacter psychrovividus]|uniref:Transcriptional regulator n=1 Tax=Persicobacter psychrovividus TaxID=387638 RepID=A0ABM7VMS7_9BACT|nr:transcriptional regulator [Persicobacter psychrovividus]